MPKRPDGKAAKTQPTAFTRPAAERIARVVRIVEKGDRDEAPLSFKRVGISAGGQGLRHVEWAGAWSAAETTTITFRSGGSTATAVNLFAGVDAGSGWVAKHSDAWSLVVCNLTTQPQYDSAEVQLLGHDDSGIIKWFSVTTCATATAS